MLVIPFLNHRQAGTNSHSGLRANDYRLNLDDVLSRFVCYENNAFGVQGEISDVPPFACKFRRDIASDLLAVANEEGDIILYDTSDNGSKILYTFAAHHNAVFDICWLPDKNQMLTASGDYLSSLWDMNSCKCVSTFMCHTASIKSIDVCNEQSAMFASGSRDGNIGIWDIRENNTTRCSKPSILIQNSHKRKKSAVPTKKHSYGKNKDATSSVSAVVFKDSKYLASAGVADGVIKVWDLRKAYVLNSKSTPSPRYQMNYAGSGCTSLVFDSPCKKLYACCTGKKIYRFDCHSYSDNVVAYEGFRCDTYFVKISLSCDDQYLLSGSSDDKAYIWKTSKPGLPIFELPGHTAEVTSVTWNPHNITKLATCGDDSKMLVWSIGNELTSDNKYVLASCKAYTKDNPTESPEMPKVESSKINSDESPEVQIKNKHVKSLTKKTSPQTPYIKKPAMKSITSFFMPVSPPISSENIFHDKVTKQDKNSFQCSKSPVSSLVLSPRKILNEDNIMHNSNSQVASNKCAVEKSPFEESNLNKENNENPVCIRNLNSVNSLGQTKRKLSPNQSTSKNRKIRNDSSSKTKGQSAKKENPATKTIKNYFIVN